MSLPPPWAENYVVRAWACHPAPERTLAIMLADLSQTPAAFLPAEVVDAVFAAAAPGWADQRREAWETYWQCPRQEIIIGGSTFTGYYPPLAWAGAVWAARLAGECQLSEAYCLELNSFPSAVIIPPP